MYLLFWCRCRDNIPDVPEVHKPPFSNTTPIGVSTEMEVARREFFALNQPFSSYETGNWGGTAVFSVRASRVQSKISGCCTFFCECRTELLHCTHHQGFPAVKPYQFTLSPVNLSLERNSLSTISPKYLYALNLFNDITATPFSLSP